MEKLSLSNFRNYKSESFEFDSDINVIFGNNGAGKTNILEAISLLAKGRGLRSAEFADMINQELGMFHCHGPQTWCYTLGSSDLGM